jgi:hypothetical protein
VVLDELIYVLAKDIQVGITKNLLCIFLVDYILQEQHEEEIKRLKLPPKYTFAYSLRKLHKPIRSTEVSMDIVDSIGAGI